MSTVPANPNFVGRQLACLDSLTSIFSSQQPESARAPGAHVGRHAAPAKQTVRGVSPDVALYKKSSTDRSARKASSLRRMQSPWISVVIPVRDSQRAIGATVRSVLNQQYAYVHEVIVVASPGDRTWCGMDEVADPRLVLWEEATPPGARDADFKRDIGVRMSSSELVAVIDSDVDLPPDWVSQEVAELQHDGTSWSRRRIDAALSRKNAVLFRREDYRLIDEPFSPDMGQKSVRRAAALARLRRFAAFGLIGGLVFAAGTIAQWCLLRAHLSSDWSYALQTLFSIELSFALNKAITWRDRSVSSARSLIRWNIQRSALAFPNCIIYDWLARETSSWMTANVIATGAFIVLNYLGANFWSFAPHRTGTRTLSLVSTTAHPGEQIAIERASSTPPCAHVDPSQYAVPPSNAEKYRYLQGGQKRWFLVVQYVAFLAVVISFAGFTTSTYWTLIFGIPLVLFVLEQTMALYTSTRRRRIDFISHQRTVDNWSPQRYPSVDVFLPTAGEELNLLDNTMRHISLLEWPGQLRVFILDDNGRAGVRDLATDYGFSYLARPGSEYKKAGNLRYGAEHTGGEIIVIFDADFVPRSDFLLELAPYMDDATIGIVQSPQFFDTSKRMNWIERCAGSTQELFYRFIQPSRDALGAAVCVGTSALYRRAALDAIGGFPMIGHSEDIYTGLWMLNAGYSIRYVPVVVSKGVTPSNVDNFIAQQYRWCEGSMTMLATKSFHTSPNLSLPARLCFWSGFLYYVGTALSSLIIPLPAIAMFWFYPQWVRPWNTIWLAGTLALWLTIYPLIMRGRWRIEVLRIQTVYGFAHAFNIVNLVRRQIVEWHPTGSKAPAPIAVKVKRFYTAYLGAALVVVATGLIVRITEDGIARFAGMLVFFLINFYVVGPLVVSGIHDEFRSLRQRRMAHAPIQVPVRVAA
jgi:cellulose synthase (UDP-forming)